MKNTDSKTRSKTNWESFEHKTDDEIDTSDIAPLGDDFFERAQWQMPAQELLVAPVDAEVLSWFKAHNGDFKQHIEAALRSYMEAHKAERSS